MTSSAAPVCTHCRAPVLPGDELHADGERVFCCAGCLSARRVIEQLGLGRFDTLGGAPGPVTAVDVDDADAVALTDAVAAARRQSLQQGVNCRFTVDVDGVSCASCAWLVEKVAGRVEGVAGATLNPARGTLELVVADTFTADALSQALSTVGHRVHPAGTRTTTNTAGDDLLFRLGASAALATTSMIASFSIFVGLAPDSAFGRLFIMVAGVSSLLAIVVGGWPFVRGAIMSVRRGAPTMDLPIAVGMIAAWTASLWAAREGAIVSFDSVAIFVTLMVAGRLVERRLVWRHRQLLTRRDDDVAGLRVRRLAPDGTLGWTTVSDVAIGDRLHLARGELVPTDAIVAVDDGNADVGNVDDDGGARSFSFAWLTGESEARIVGGGQAVVAGAHVTDPRGATVVVTRPFSSTRLSSLLATRADDDVERPVASGIFPWLARVWVAGAFAVAALGAIVWWQAPMARLLEVVAGLLVVTCPCAFGIAAPLAVERATVLLRERGVFVRHPRLWWRAGTVTHAVFDKTGTLTQDEPVVDSRGRAALAALSPAARAAVCAVVARSNHGRSRALWRSLRDATATRSTTVNDAVQVWETPGQGLRGQVGAVVVQVERDVDDDGATRITVKSDGTTEVAVVGFTEALRRGAAAALARLQAAGVTVWIASGDSADRTVALAAKVGVPAERVVAPCQPEDKKALVQRLGAEHTLVVGDGVNDAAMFEVAAVCGVPATDRPHLPARADFMLLGSSEGGAFGSVIDVVILARRLRLTLSVLLAVATIYNLAVVTAGLMGLLTPLLVALLMPTMSVSLLGIALLLVRLPLEREAPASTPTIQTLEVPA